MNNTWWLSETDLKEEQWTIVSAPIDESSLILGPPGSGKTNLLLLRAKYLALAKKDFVLLTFTNTLQGFIASGAAQYKISPSSILTSWKFFTNLLYSYGKIVTLPDKFEDARIALIEAVEKLVEERGLDQIHEAILLDEAHDYLPSEIKLFRHMSKVLIAVGDARQMIYRAEGSIEALKAAVGHQYELKHHYRSALKICKVADALAKDSKLYVPLSPSCNYDEDAMPSSIEHAAFPSVELQAQEILKKLVPQVRAYPDEFIGVICPRKEELNKGASLNWVGKGGRDGKCEAASRPITNSLEV